MKEFEKWWLENMPDDMRYESAYHKALLQDGWKAALEWALTRCDSDREKCVHNDIEEELEDKK